jgi:hypothetical protein
VKVMTKRGWWCGLCVQIGLEAVVVVVKGGKRRGKRGPLDQDVVRVYTSLVTKHESHPTPP